MTQKEFAVIGCGRFGTNLALTLAELGNEVIAIDVDSDVVDYLSDFVTHAVVADVTQEHVLEDLGISNVDVAIVGMSSNFQASVFATIGCKDLGVNHVIVKARDEKHGRILQKVGADSVIIPEKDMGVRLAHSLTSKSIVEYIGLSEDYSLVEIKAPESWHAKTLAQSNVRAAYGVNVVAIVREADVNINPNPADVIRSGDLLFVLGTVESIRAIEALK